MSGFVELRADGVYARVSVPSDKDDAVRQKREAAQTLRELAQALEVMAGATPQIERPRIVCLCGSTLFWKTFQQASLLETLAGKIVLSIGAMTGSDDDHFQHLPKEHYEKVKAELDELHLRKIELADEVLILNVGGYVGESTQRELDYARKLGKRVRLWDELAHPAALISGGEGDS